MNRSHNIGKSTLILLSAAVIALSGWWGSASSPAEASGASAPVCGKSGQGLQEALQGKNTNAEGLVFKDVDFLSKNTGRAAGNGFLIGTSDGCQFQKIYQGQWNFTDIDFPDNVHGWALASVQDGQAKYLIRTQDGGSTWKRMTNKATNFERIEFTDSRQGFGYSRAQTYSTKDGGASWSQIPTPPNTRGAYFTSPSSGWAVVVVPGSGYRVMRTTDGGTTWKQSLSSAFAYPEYGQIYAKDGQVYALLYGGSGMSQTSYSLYASANNGTSWRRVIAQSTAGGGAAPGSGTAQAKKGPASGRPGNMQLLGGSTAFLAGFSPAGEQVAVGRTSNAGKQWVNLPAVPGYEGMISFTGSKEGWMAVNGPKTSSLYATQDGGSTWKVNLEWKRP